MKTLLTRKKLYREKFKLFSVFPSELFSYRADSSIALKKLVEQRIQVVINSKRRHKHGLVGSKAPDVDHRPRMPSGGSHGWLGGGGKGPGPQPNRQHPPTAPQRPLSIPSQEGLLENPREAITSTACEYRPSGGGHPPTTYVSCAGALNLSQTPPHHPREQ